MEDGWLQSSPKSAINSLDRSKSEKKVGEEKEVKNQVRGVSILHSHRFFLDAPIIFSFDIDDWERIQNSIGDFSSFQSSFHWSQKINQMTEKIR